MLLQLIQHFETQIEGLSFDDKRSSLIRFILELKDKNIKKDDFSVEHLIALTNTLIKKNTPENIKQELNIYLTYYTLNILNALDSDTVSKTEEVDVESTSNYKVEDWAKMPESETIQLDPSEMPPIKDDLEFLKLIGKTNVFDQQ